MVNTIDEKLALNVRTPVGGIKVAAIPSLVTSARTVSVGSPQDINMNKVGEKLKNIIIFFLYLVIFLK